MVGVSVKKKLLVEIIARSVVRPISKRTMKNTTQSFTTVLSTREDIDRPKPCAVPLTCSSSSSTSLRLTHHTSLVTPIGPLCHLYNIRALNCFLHFPAGYWSPHWEMLPIRMSEPHKYSLYCDWYYRTQLICPDLASELFTIDCLAEGCPVFAEVRFRCSGHLTETVLRLQRIEVPMQWQE